MVLIRRESLNIGRQSSCGLTGLELLLSITGDQKLSKPGRMRRLDWK